MWHGVAWVVHKGLGGVGHAGVGWVMQGWGVSCKGGVGHAGVGWGGLCMVGWVVVGGSCRGGVGHVGVGWVIQGWSGL